jgi:hypothetical protein
LSRCDELFDYNPFSTHAALVDACRSQGAAASRLAAAAPAAFGTLPAATDYDALIERTFAP